MTMVQPDVSQQSQKPWGPDNPHPLSKVSTELVWEGKYDEYGNRRVVDVAACSMPMQKIETIDQPRSEAAACGKLDLFERNSNRQDDFRNRLIWGDNKLITASLLKEFKGKIDLIYIDPPFDVGADFTMDVPIGDGKDSLGKDQSTMEMVAYRDTWGKGTDSYIHMMYERLSPMKDLLSDNGSIFVHLAYPVAHACKLLLDEIFGRNNFRNEIVLKRRITKNLQQQFATVQALNWAHDVMFWYSVRSETRYKPTFVPMETRAPEGYWHHFWSGADRPTMRYELLGVRPSSGQWKWSRERALRAVENYNEYVKKHSAKMSLVEYWRSTGEQLAFIRLSASGKVENWFPPSSERIADTIWTDIHTYENEKDYATQKHEELLDRVITGYSSEGGLVADFFCGSGTTGAVAERLGRRWIMADLGRFAIHTTRKRMIELQRKLHAEQKPYRAFDVYNLGRYERQWWHTEYLVGGDAEHRQIVLEFFQAEPIKNAPSSLLHGRKSGAWCHVDGIDSVFTRKEANAVANAVAEAGGRECYVLAWEFEMDLRLHLAAIEQGLGVKLKLIPIPREIMERNRKSPPPFLEVAVLEARATVKRSGVDVKITKFIPSLAEIPSKEIEEVRKRALKTGTDFIDFWAIDFDWAPGRPFSHHWQDYRTRKDRSLKLESDAEHKYPKPGKYMICVKVVDTFGCDTSIAVPVEVK